MRLLKAVAYGLLGYVIYEMYLGVCEGAPSQQRAGNPQRIAKRGGKKMMRAQTQESSGTSATHPVGRGVI